MRLQASRSELQYGARAKSERGKDHVGLRTITFIPNGLKRWHVTDMCYRGKMQKGRLKIYIQCRILFVKHLLRSTSPPGSSRIPLSPFASHQLIVLGGMEHNAALQPPRTFSQPYSCRHILCRERQCSVSSPDEPKP